MSQSHRPIVALDSRSLACRLASCLLVCLLLVCLLGCRDKYSAKSLAKRTDSAEFIIEGIQSSDDDVQEKALRGAAQLQGDAALQFAKKRVDVNPMRDFLRTRSAGRIDVKKVREMLNNPVEHWRAEGVELELEEVRGKLKDDVEALVFLSPQGQVQLALACAERIVKVYDPKVHAIRSLLGGIDALSDEAASQICIDVLLVQANDIQQNALEWLGENLGPKK